MGKPYTVKFGPWLPDLQDVGIEMPFQWTETELPVADCENVYYQDAAYRCLPAPAPVGPSLGTAILASYTWYDNTAGKEVVFAATANGFYTLVDGVWTQVPVQQNAGAGTVGYAVSMGMGVPFATAVYLTPQSQSQVGTSTSFTAAPVTANVGNGSPSGYSWTFSGQSGPGTWSVASGQGTSVATPEVTGVTANSTASVTLNCAITINGGVYSCSGSLSYKNSPPPTQVTHTSGSGTQTVPAGYNHVIIESASGSGGGEGGDYNSGTHQSFGGSGGDSSTYSRSLYSCSAGETVNYAVGAAGIGGTGGSFGPPGPGGASSVTSGTLSITTMSCPGGNTGGTPTGGNQANSGPNHGTAGALNSRGIGGTAISGVHITAPAGGNGGLGVGGGSNGGGGIVSFYFYFA
jgi:hypothetical protein